MGRTNSLGWCPYAAAKLQPHEAWRVLVDIIQGETVVITTPFRRPVVGILNQAPLGVLKDWLGVDAFDGNSDGEWLAACPFQAYGCRCIVSIDPEMPVRGGCASRAPSQANSPLPGYFHEWARDMMIALRAHLKQEFTRVSVDVASARLRDAHIELHMMLVRAPLALFLSYPCWQEPG
jgi:hypothetical protein